MLVESQARRSVPKRQYWADAVSPFGKIAIEQLRVAHLPMYLDHRRDGYRAVDDIAPQTRGIYLDLANHQKRIAMQWAIAERIKKLEAEDTKLRRGRTYEAVFGVVRPRRGRKWREITEEAHVSFQPTGVTIMAKDIEQSKSVAHAAVAELGVVYAYS